MTQASCQIRISSWPRSRHNSMILVVDAVGDRGSGLRPAQSPGVSRRLRIFPGDGARLAVAWLRGAEPKPSLQRKLDRVHPRQLATEGFPSSFFFLSRLEIDAEDR